MMRIVVTGGSGFLGKALARRLKQDGHDVVLPLRRHAVRLDPVTAGAPEPEILPLEKMETEHWRPLLAGADAVIHAAAIAHIGPGVAETVYNAVNRDASARLAEAAAVEGVKRFIFLSSIRAQSGPSSPVVQTEQIAPVPTEAYGRSKLEAEGLIRQWLPQATILRPAIIVGAEPKGNLRTLLKLAALPVPLPFGALNAPQAMASLDGVIDAVVLALSHPAMTGETYCVADRPHLSLTEVLTALRQGLGRSRWLLPVPQRLLSLPLAAVGWKAWAEKLGGGLDVDPAKLMALGWHPREPMKTVLQRMGAAYIRSRAN
jgi:nucleoside-diphosphate-sugar epimerase